uniref:DH domain-containing protein n=1 Tax=Meloidogyne incognita TaxID=6306 RepID=A0A914LFA5_MELIC
MWQCCEMNYHFLLETKLQFLIVLLMSYGMEFVGLEVGGFLLHIFEEYVRLLEHLVMGFLEQCRRRRELFPEERILRIFGNLELIYSLHTNIFKELLNVLDEEKPESTCLANVFLKNSQQFGIYTDYCNNRTLSCTELAQLEQQSQYFHFFEACRLLRALPKLSLDAFLLTPVQRICRYPLQLLELLKATPPNHPDRLALELTQRTMKLIASKVNDGKRRVDAIQKIWLWQNSVHGFRYSFLGKSSEPKNLRFFGSGTPQLTASPTRRRAITSFRIVESGAPWYSSIQLVEAHRNIPRRTGFDNSEQSYSSAGPNLIESNHRLLINGELQCRALWNGQLQWSKNGLIIYLFDQTIVLCKRDVLRRSNLIFKERMGMGGTTLYDLHDGKDPLTCTTLKNAFKLSGPAREYIFCCQDAATKSLWLEAIRNRPRPQPPSQAERRLAMLI